MTDGQPYRARLTFVISYFNTVGSKEGWSPSTFVSSRANKKKDVAPAQQKPEDFMDEEDLADAEEARKLQTADSFAGLGSTEEEISQRGSLVDLLKASGETMGVRLLRRMGWRDGQGVGPKVRRKARLDDRDGVEGGDSRETHLFAPENSEMISFVRKNDHKGLGFEGEGRLSELPSIDAHRKPNGGLADGDDDVGIGTLRNTQAKKKKPAVRGGLGVGILNDTGSDDEDPYHMGPQVSYNRVIGGDKKKKKSETNKSILGSANPLLGAKPIFISSKAAKSKASSGFRRCHDGRLPLDGFVLSANLDPLSSSTQNQDGKYPPPEIPSDWKSSKSPTSTPATTNYQSTASASAASNHDPKSRASLLGETPLPGKSIFDYLTPAARSRIASATGKTNLPSALSEVPPPSYGGSAGTTASDLASLVPHLPRSTALTALGRGPGGWMPYGEDPAKRTRYRRFLELHAGLVDGLPPRAPNTATDDWVHELQEFAQAARIFKPMTGAIASRFTSASSPHPPATTDTPAPTAAPLLARPAPAPESPAAHAARLAMYGPLTRSTVAFFPARLLCKRFNVPPPSHVQADAGAAGDEGGRGQAGGGEGGAG